MTVGFVATAFNPCQWYRLYEPFRAYAGAKLFLAPECGRDPRMVAEAGDCDVVQLNWVHRPDELRLMRDLHGLGAKIAIDYDDDVRQMSADYDLAKVVRAACVRADLVTVSTPELAAAFGDIAAQKVFVLPNRIDTSQWLPAPPPRGARVVIGYAGSRNHTADFEAIAPAIWQLMGEERRIALRLLGCDPIAVPARLAARVEQRRWVGLGEHRAAIAGLEADVAIAPLQPTPFNRGRSPLKYLQWGALGVPLVAAAIAPYSRVIEHGRTGFLAGGLAAWYGSLRALCQDAFFRAWMGSQARADVVSCHDLSRDARLRSAAYARIVRAA